VCLYPHNLGWTLSLTLVVGSILFAINQLDVVLSGGATPRVWLKTGLTFLDRSSSRTAGSCSGAGRDSIDPRRADSLTPKISTVTPRQNPIYPWCSAAP
jgi:hypothetical protein